MLNTITAGGLTLPIFLICTAASLVLGVLSAGLFMYKNNYSRGLVLTLALLPAVVQLVIMMVNGSIGTGVAVAGTFSLIRFRSQPGSARDIASIFIAVAIGISVGMGYVAVAVIFFVIIALFTILLINVRFGESGSAERDLRITIPEDMDYEGLFDDLFEKYTRSHELVRVKTTNMGTLYELRYDIVLSTSGISKAFLDDIRCRNGNLNVICGRSNCGDAL